MQKMREADNQCIAFIHLRFFHRTLCRSCQSIGTIQWPFFARWCSEPSPLDLRFILPPLGSTA